MSVRSRVAAPAMTSGPGTALAVADPAAMVAAAEGPSQMGMDHPFAPGEPVGPYDGYSRTPRSFDFTTGYNIATRPRTHERVSFSTLRGLIEAYDIAQLCLWHRIDSIRSLDWKLTAADGYSGDITDAVKTGMAALRKPDRQDSFGTWLAKWLYDVLAYDAGCLYRLRNQAGRCIGLKVVDGTLIAPLLDYWGNSPEPPAEAYVQYANGLPWNWLTRDDLIYEPFRPRANSPYGHAPLESIILNANTDIRFQVYFLQRFTEGNIPEAFASAPESWNPDQIETFQAYWDSFMYSDSARKHQIRWIPGGSTFAWSNEKDFSDQFSLHLMRKSAAAYHVVPTDLGFTDSANYSTGESQADVQHRVGDLPLGHYVERIITSFLQDDLGLPLQHQFDWGEEQDDRLNQAQADAIYVEHAVVSASELREMRFGLAEPEGQVVPRIFFTARSGPIPLASLYGVSGKIDPETAAPDPGVPLPREAFTEVQGVVPNPPLISEPLAEQEFGPKAVPPAPPPQPPGIPEPTDPARQVAKEDGTVTTGITSETGITSYDLIGRDEDDDGPDDEQARIAAVKSELAAFHRFRRARRKAGTWRDFEFRATGAVRAHNLNDSGRAEVRKAAGEIAVAGLAVLAADTGRVLMLQRALDSDDPAAGMWEFPGGHLDGSETPLQGAWREWAEETGAIPPPGTQTGSWTAGDGIYQGIVWTTESESAVPVRCDTEITNPDDPDGDQVEAIAWWDPAQLPGNPAVRPELAASTGDVMAALGVTGEGTCGPAGIAKAGDAAPKAPAPDGQPVQQAWPGWNHDLQAAGYWAGIIAAALLAALSPDSVAAGWLATGSATEHQAATWLRQYAPAVQDALGDAVEGARADGWAIGSVSASQLGGIQADMAGWEPGASQVARELAGNLGTGDGLADMLRDVKITIKSVAQSRLEELGRVLAQGARDGLSADDLAALIEGVLSNPERARMIALTEVSRAANSAAMWTYRLQGVTDLVWLTAEDDHVCPDCDAEEARGARPVNEPPDAPLHPLCRCARVPA